MPERQRRFFFVRPRREDLANRIRELERYRPSVGEVASVVVEFRQGHDVPEHNAKVRFVFKKEGFLPYTQDVIADREQTVTAKLEAEKKAAPPLEANKPKKKKTDENAKPGEEEPLQVDF